MTILFQRMQVISFWASQNVILSRWILAIGMILLNSVAGFIGLLLYDMNVILPFEGVWIMLGIIFIASFLYPNKKAKYKLRKTFDLVLFSSIALCFLCVSNQESALIEQEESEILEEISINQQERNNVFRLVSSFDENPSPKDEIKKIKRQKLTKVERNKVRDFYKKIIKEIRKTSKTRQLSSGEKILYTILSSLLFLGLSVLVAGLACNLACSNSGVLSVIVLVLGLGGLIVGLIFLLKHIWRKEN